MYSQYGQDGTIQQNVLIVLQLLIATSSFFTLFLFEEVIFWFLSPRNQKSGSLRNHYYALQLLNTLCNPVIEKGHKLRLWNNLLWLANQSLFYIFITTNLKFFTLMSVHLYKLSATGKRRSFLEAGWTLASFNWLLSCKIIMLIFRLNDILLFEQFQTELESWLVSKESKAVNLYINLH